MQTIEKQSLTDKRSKLNVLLTGASGTVGSEAMKQFAEMPDVNLTVFDIKKAKSEKLFAPFTHKMETIYGDISNAADVEKAVQGKDVVVHLAAIIPPLADDNPSLAYKVNVLGTKNLVEAMEKWVPEAFLMYSSSVSVYGDRVENPNIRVGDPLQPSVGDEYARTKLECERIVQSSRLRWTILRLAAIMGNHKISKLMFHMPLATTMEICTPPDTARAFVNGLRKEEALEGKIFNLGGGLQCTTTFEEFLKRSFRLYGLGELNFAENAFATTNFHCGYYADGDDLEEIVHFRRDTLDDFLKKMADGISPFTKFFAIIFRYPVKKYLQSLSEPQQALKEKNRPMIERFFGVGEKL